MRLGIISVAAAAAIGLSITAAMAQTAPAEPATAGTGPASADAVASAGDPNKVVCKRLSETGTRLGGKRICQTQSEWDAQARQSQLDVGHEQTRGSLFSTPNR